MALGGALDNCLWFLLPEEFFADLMNDDDVDDDYAYPRII